MTKPLFAPWLAPGRVTHAAAMIALTVRFYSLIGGSK
jgi:hypothetical protein